MQTSIDDIADLEPGLIAFRRDLHRHPELGFNEQRTAEKVATALHEAGIEVHRGVGGTGLVGVLKRQRHRQYFVARRYGRPADQREIHP